MYNTGYNTLKTYTTQYYPNFKICTEVDKFLKETMKFNEIVPKQRF